MEKRSKEDVREYLQINHEYETVRELAENLGMPEQTIRGLLKKNNLTLYSPCHNRKALKKESIKVEEPICNKFSRMLEEEKVKEAFFESLANCQDKKSTQHVTGVYNQSGSPYGIATELSGINIKR